MRKNNVYVIIGNSASGLAAIESIRRIDKSSKIINISKEPHQPYSRCLLSYYLAGQYDRDILWIRPDDYYSKFGVEPLLNKAVTGIDIKAGIVEISNKKKIVFDKLLIATGASAKSIDIPGADKKGVFVLRTLEDADGILKMLPNVKRVCILGGGLIGMRAAYALKKRGTAVHVIVKSDHIFSQMLDSEAADIMRRHLEANGIDISTGLEAKEITGKGSVKGIVLDDGNQLDCELVIIGKGVSANLDIVKSKVKTNAGILVDEHLETDKKGIYAAGDVAQAYDILEERTNMNQIWPIAIRQGKIAGLNMAGEDTKYDGSYGMNSLDFFDLAVMSFGLVKPKGDEFEELIAIDTNRVLYRKIVLKGNRIVGGVLINDVERHGILLNLALQKIDISDVKDILIDEYFDFGKVIPLIKRQSRRFIRPEYRDTAEAYQNV
ncbi:MAG: NAD(P)/FAD-dependent oxidoreductase [Candidatus Omnitrophica bacterium]|nr:NAD(P)/FAD-dependent oxidoreductase [Candidatus Omnitrophota bacterium]